MTNINNQSQVLDKIAGLEDLDHENAAVCSGGRITLYDGRNKTGTAVSFGGGSVANLTRFGFNNKASSIGITNGQTWTLWRDANFKGNSITYGPGHYNLAGIFNNSISSISRIA
ncbi:MAG: beta/gamma crystallin-related protein [Gloeotrichia echinulata HAB0833]